MPELPDVPDDPSARAIRAQLLATEHWSLLASRSTAQGEVLTRIQMHLTFVSASLLSLALLGNATGFADPFPMLACVLLLIALIMGVLTQVRVVNVGGDDLMFVLAMNRLRGAYIRLSPGIEGDFVAGATDDLDGVDRTYYALARRSAASQLVGSSMLFSITLNAVIAGLLLGVVLVVVGVATVVGVVLGAVVAAAYIAVSMLLGFRGYAATWRDWRPRYPGPGQAD